MIQITTVTVIFVTSLLCHIGICRASGQDHFLLKGLAVGVAGTVTLIAINIGAGKPWGIQAYIFFSAWIFFLMTFINLLNSVTLKMLSLLHLESNHALSHEQLSAALSDVSGFDTRFRMMDQNKLIIHHDNLIKLSLKGRRLTQIIGVVRRALAVS